MTKGINNPITDHHSFRQAQTAITTYSELIPLLSSVSFLIMKLEKLCIKLPYLGCHGYLALHFVQAIEGKEWRVLGLSPRELIPNR